MMIQYTLGMIKPNAVKKKYIGPIITQIEKAGFHISQLRLAKLMIDQAREFYAIHAHCTFYQELCAYISSAPVLALVLKKEHAVDDFRTLIGNTDPAKAAQGTLRKQFGTSINNNALHGSDSVETAAKEIAFFFVAQDST